LQARSKNGKQERQARTASKNGKQERKGYKPLRKGDTDEEVNKWKRCVSNIASVWIVDAKDHRNSP